MSIGRPQEDGELTLKGKVVYEDEFGEDNIEEVEVVEAVFNRERRRIRRRTQSQVAACYCGY